MRVFSECKAGEQCDCLGRVADGQDWLDVARPSIQERMQRWAEFDGVLNFSVNSGVPFSVAIARGRYILI